MTEYLVFRILVRAREAGWLLQVPTDWLRMSLSDPKPSSAVLDSLEPKPSGAALDKLHYQRVQPFVTNLDVGYRVLRIASRVAASLWEVDESNLGSGLPGDENVNPAPFEGMGLSKNPHPKISPQVITDAVCQPYTGSKLMGSRGDSPETWAPANPRHEERTCRALRNLAERDWSK